jgi:Fe-S-cluster containining protein
MRAERELIDRFIIGLEAADRLWKEKAGDLATGDLACRSGCFGCCVGLFAIGLPEALAVRLAVADLPEESRAGLLARAERAVAKSAPLFPGDPAAGVLDPDRSDAADAAFFESLRATACPVLELPSGRCSVYAARPTTCRTFGLALAAEGAIVLPACELNLPSAPRARVRETAIEASRLAEVDQSLVELALSAGLPAGAETTVAHALLGSAFDALEPLAGLSRPRSPVPSAPRPLRPGPG